MMHGASKCLNTGSKTRSIFHRPTFPKVNNDLNIRSISPIPHIRNSSNAFRQGKTQVGKAGEKTNGIGRKGQKARVTKIHTTSGVRVVAIHGANKVVLIINRPAVYGGNKDKINSTLTKSSREVAVAEKNM